MAVALRTTSVQIGGGVLWRFRRFAYGFHRISLCSRRFGFFSTKTPLGFSLDSRSCVGLLNLGSLLDLKSGLRWFGLQTVKFRSVISFYGGSKLVACGLSFSVFGAAVLLEFYRFRLLFKTSLLPWVFLSVCSDVRLFGSKEPLLPVACCRKGLLVRVLCPCWRLVHSPSLIVANLTYHLFLLF